VQVGGLRGEHPDVRVPETARTARDLPVRLRQVARHDPLVALRLGRVTAGV